MDQRQENAECECAVYKPVNLQDAEEAGCSVSVADDICLDKDGENGDRDDRDTGSSSSLIGESGDNLLGRVVNSEQEAYELYRDYGHRLGFSVRRGKQSYFIGTRMIRTKVYCCSKEGFKVDENPTEMNHTKLDTRTGCKAMIHFTADRKGQWKVTRFVPEHNHEFVSPDERHRLRSAKPMLSTDVQTVGACNVVGKAGLARDNDFAKSVERHPPRPVQSVVDAKSSVPEAMMDAGTQPVEAYYKVEEAELEYRRRAMHYAYILVTKSQAHEEMRKVLLDAFDRADVALDTCLSKLSSDARSAARDRETNAGDGIPMLSPCISDKGVLNSRHKEHFEKHKKKKLKGVKSSRKENEATGASSEIVSAAQASPTPKHPRKNPCQSPLELSASNPIPVQQNLRNHLFPAPPQPVLDPTSNLFPVRPDPRGCVFPVPPGPRNSPLRAPFLNLCQESSAKD